MNDTFKPTSPETKVCRDQQQRSQLVVQELKRTTRRLERDKVVSVFQVQVYAFNCTNRENHPKEHTDPFHIDFIAEGGRMDVPGALQVSITALERALVELKKRVQ